MITERLHQRVRFEADGTGRRDLRVRARVQTEAGVQAGYDAELSKWDAAAVAFAHEETRKFEGQSRQRGAA